MRPRAQSIGANTSYNLFQLLFKELELSNDELVEQPQPLITPNESLIQIKNMIQLPYYLENFMLFGLLSCLNAFLTLLIILPLKLILNAFRLILRFRKQFIVKKNHKQIALPKKYRNNRSERSQKTVKDVIFTSLILISIITCSKTIDTSKIYHNIRAQSSIKLYVLFGVLEISDKLLSTVGQDLLNFTLKQSTIKLGDSFVFIPFFVVSSCYLSIHTTILIYQTIALNVAANSYSNSLLTLLLSNQFSEIKSAVFKKIDREGLFQMSCSDIVERFQLLLMLSIISLRNMVQLGSISQNDYGLLPYSISWNYKILGVIFGPTTFVIGSELLVDWVKHSYIIKFNKIKSNIYLDKFSTILSSDFIECFKKTGSSQNNMDLKLQQRLGLPLHSLFVLFMVMSWPSIKWVLFNDTRNLILSNVVLIVFGFVILLLFKLLLELALLKWSTNIKKRKTASSLENGEALSDIDYTPGNISTSLSTLDENSRRKLYDGNKKIPKNLNQVRLEKDSKSNLGKVTRYQMFSKRIW